MRTLIIIAVQITALLVINRVGYALAAALHLPLPGNLLGMLLLLSLLATRVVPLGWVESSASVLVRHLGFFFVPITVGLMSLGELFLDNGIAILITLVVSAAIGIGVAGLSSQRLASTRDRRAS